MSIEAAIRSHLIAGVSVSALIGTRVYPMYLAHGYTLPAISYQRISSPRARAIDGPTGRVIARFQVDCWARSYSQARSLADSVRLALDNHRGTLGSGDQAMSDVGTITLDADRDGFNTNTEEYRVTLEFLVPYIEAVE